MNEEDELIDLLTAAQRAGIKVNPSTLRRAAQSGKLKARKIGRDWVTTVRDLKAWHENPQYHKFAPRKHRPKT